MPTAPGDNVAPIAGSGDQTPVTYLPRKDGNSGAADGYLWPWYRKYPPHDLMLSNIPLLGHLIWMEAKPDGGKVFAFR